MMYQVLGEEVFDSKDISAILEDKTDFQVREDMTKRTKREDALAFKLSISVDKLMAGLERYIEDEDKMSELMSLADERLKGQLSDIEIPHILWETYAYSYDEVDNEVLLVAAMMNIENGRRKLPDIIKRLLSQV